MDAIRRCVALVLLFTLVVNVSAQTITPSNSSSLNPDSYYPRFVVRSANSSQFPTFEVAPLGSYAVISRQWFLNVHLTGNFVQTTPFNVRDVDQSDIAYISCDPADYADSNLGPGEVLTLISELRKSIMIIILYTQTGIHCDVSMFTKQWQEMVIVSTVDPVVAGQIADMSLDRSAGVQAIITGNASTFIDPTAPGWSGTGGWYGGGPTTAVAMIILYTITGVITAIFLAIILIGAIRAHRHPERYGPRRGDHARGRQSRAKGIARALLETIPIVKFGDQQKTDQSKGHDVEMPATSVQQQKEVAVTISPTTPRTMATEPSSTASKSPITNADGSDETGSLGCSICTEDFHQGEQVRVLPCNHKFHPDCVDPWLLNVSGTCPLCRVDLRNPSSAGLDDISSSSDATGVINTNTNTIQALRAALSQPREERIAALRRFRTERRNRNSSYVTAAGAIGGVGGGGDQEGDDEEQRRGLANRLMARFRVGTRTHQSQSQHGAGLGGISDDTRAQARFLAMR